MMDTTLSRLLPPDSRDGDPEKIEAQVRASGCCRFSLSYSWDPLLPVLPWLLLNPSLAGTKSRFDPTTRRVIRFSYRWGFGGCLLLNIIPYISSRPAEMFKWVKWEDRGDWAARDAMFTNWRTLQAELADHDAVMVAWGSAFGSRPEPDRYEFDVMVEAAFDTINEPDGPRKSILRTFCLGMTASGYPLHPMARGKHRVPDTALPQISPQQFGSIVGLGEEAHP